MARTHDQSAKHDALRGLRVAVRDDAAAFGYSILITAAFGLANLEDAPVTVGRLFLFVFGATGAFAVIEAISSRLFRVRIREERSEVVLIGTAMAPLAVGTSLAAAWGTAVSAEGGVSWALTPAVATCVYVLFTGGQLVLARRYARRHPPKDSD